MNVTKERPKHSLYICHHRVQMALTQCCFCYCWFCSIFCAVAALIFENKCETKMKLKVSAKWTEQDYSGNDHCKYFIIVFKRHLPSNVAVDVDVVLFFVLLLHLLFENNRQTKLKLKVSRKWTEQNNCRRAVRKYAIK